MSRSVKLRPDEFDPDAKVSRMSIAFNLSLLFNLLKKWSGLTIIITAALCGWITYYFTREYGFTSAEITIVIISYIAALAYLKAFLLIITYPSINKTAFEGSLFVMALLVTFFR
jgi:hypothetical protein